MNKTNKKTALIVGANGVIGSNLTEHLLSLGDIGISSDCREEEEQPRVI